MSNRTHDDGHDARPPKRPKNSLMRSATRYLCC